ncbi:MAG: PAS domain S-box protein [Anaerolineales bacterium]|nr:PAS domain S-box protein [Anaerolineales bacterium]
MRRPFQKRMSTKISLRFLIVSLFIIQSFLVVGMVSFFAFSNARRTITRIVDNLHTETSHHIEQHLDEFLAIPGATNQISANAIRQGWLNVNDPVMLEHYFAEQARVLESVSSIYFGNQEGGLVDASRVGADEQLYVLVTDDFTSGTLRKYVIDGEGNRLELVETLPNFDARTRTWYTAAVAKGGPTWSDLYVLFTGEDMAIAASLPVYDVQHQLLGVVSTDIFVSELSDFLQRLERDEKTASFIMDRSGLLVASSTGEKPFIPAKDGEPSRRLYASESAMPLTRAAADFLATQFSDYHQISSTKKLEFELDGERQFLQISPVDDEYGIDWLVVILLSESEFAPQVNALRSMTLLNVATALLLSIVLGIITARWLSKPVLRLNKSANSLAQGNWHQTFDREWIGEIDELAQSFNYMIKHLKQTVESLNGEIAIRMQAEEMLRESEEKYRSLIEHSSDAIYLLYEGQFAIVNLRFTELFGVTAEEVCSPDFNFMSLVAPKSRPYIKERIAKRRQGEELPPYYTFTAQDKAGNEIEVEASVSYVPYKQATATQGVLRNVTERVWTTKMLRQSNQRLEETLAELHETQEQMLHQERLAAVGRLAAGVAHDFNNLLATITIYTQMVLEMDDPPPTIRQRLSIIDSQASQGAALVQQIMDFGRRSRIVQVTFALDLLLEEMVELLRHTFPANIRLVFSFESGEYLIEADRTSVQQAILNLALNARNVMPDGGKLHITLSRVSNVPFNCIECGSVEGGEWLLVEVRDSGSGISDDVLPHLFEPFFTTRGPMGHGLGLAQVYGIVKQHNGHIGVETEVGQGSTFKLYWPAPSAT